MFPHQGLGVVIGPRVKVGKRCVIHQNVTIGAKSNGRDIGFPTIGNDVMIGCGAVLLGNIRIGNNVAIGANSVVLDSVPNDVVVTGIPARIVRNK